MYVESYDEEGAAVYDMIIKQIFQDLQLGPSIVDLRAFVNILKVLWREFGRENVHQPNRYAIVLEGNQMQVADFVVDNPQINLQKRIYDGIYRILPEGFKIIKDLSRDGVVAVVATDELIKDDWMEKCEEYIDELNQVN